MNKNIKIIAILVLAVVAGGVILFGGKQNKDMVQLPTTSPSPNSLEEKVSIRASFKIITGNITRSFVSSKYHQKSPDVYISADDPTKVYVAKKGITWADFFNTLPMQLTKDCLITGDDETLCNSQSGSLKFYLNDIEDKDLLDREIQEGDKILVTFK